MSIEFDYEILSVNDDFGTMDVRYSAAGHQQHIISVRQPTLDEDFEEVIKMFAPIPTWEIMGMERQSIQTGKSGTIAPPTPVEPSYVEKRIFAYPPIEDYVDGIVKGDDAQVQAYIDACLAVKRDIPKD